MVVVVGAVALVVPRMMAAHAAGTVYYVDAISGSDASSGVSESAPWKSLSKVNSTTFQAGDRILLRAGRTWTGQLWPKGSGASGAPITVDSYGSGNKPRIDGAGQVGDAVRLFNQEYWTIRNLEVTNTVPSTGTPGANLRDLRGIHVGGDNSQTLDGFLIDSVYVHDVTGEINWIGGDTADNAPGIRFKTGWDGSKKTGGIVFDTTVPNVTRPPANPTILNNLTVTNSQIMNTSFAGIVVKQYTGDGKDAAGNTIATATGWGTRTSASDTKFRPHTNVTIRNNYITQSGTAYGCNGIYLTGVRGGLVERNVVQRVGTSGIETYFADNVTIQYNEVYDTQKKAGGADSNGIDADKGTTAQKIQYNWLHGNGDGILLCQFSFGDVVVRYNVLTSNTRYQIYLHSDQAASAKIYNNTIYNDRSGYLVYGYGKYLTSTYTLNNNIFYSTRADAVLSSSSTVRYQRNLYGGASLTVPGDSNAVVANPRFVAAPITGPSGTPSTGPQLASAYALKLASGSPAINAGLTISDHGGRDFAGAALYNGAPDIGAFEQPSTSPTPSPTTSPTASPTPTTPTSRVVAQHGFDNLAVGPLTNGTEGLAVGAAGGQVSVVATPSTTDHSLRLTRSANSGSTSVSRSFSPPLTGKVTVEADIMRPSAWTSGNDYFGVPYIRNSNGQNAVSLAVTKNTIAAYSGTTLVTVGSYTPGRWYHLSAVIDIPSQTFDLFLDGRLVLDNSPFRTSLGGVAQIDYYANSSNYGTVLVDNVTVTAAG
ncbi:right-handed parallel beta-helix repeat-containing protein [Micromonospora sp. KC606]|nr:right-handed parallel beta-helix repeat-containing protein [Micromonospora sp. KC606]